MGSDIKQEILCYIDASIGSRFFTWCENDVKRLIIKATAPPVLAFNTLKILMGDRANNMSANAFCKL